MPPLCDEQTFSHLMAGMVADEAPRVFAIVEEFGVRADGHIVAWGIAFDGRAEVIGVHGGVHLSTRSADSALHRFGSISQGTPRVVWVDPDAATPAD